MNKVLKESIKKSLKEGARVFLMAVLPLVIIELENGDFNFRAVLIAGVIATIRFVDKLLHKTITKKGLVRF